MLANKYGRTLPLPFLDFAVHYLLLSFIQSGFSSYYFCSQDLLLGFFLPTWFNAVNHSCTDAVSSRCWFVCVCVCVVDVV